MKLRIRPLLRPGICLTMMMVRSLSTLSVSSQIPELVTIKVAQQFHGLKKRVTKAMLNADAEDPKEARETDTRANLLQVLVCVPMVRSLIIRAKFLINIMDRKLRRELTVRH